MNPILSGGTHVAIDDDQEAEVVRFLPAGERGPLGVLVVMHGGLSTLHCEVDRYLLRARKMPDLSQGEGTLHMFPADRVQELQDRLSWWLLFYARQMGISPAKIEAALQRAIKVHHARLGRCP